IYERFKFRGHFAGVVALARFDLHEKRRVRQWVANGVECEYVAGLQGGPQGMRDRLPIDILVFGSQTGTFSIRSVEFFQNRDDVADGCALLKGLAAYLV